MTEDDEKEVSIFHNHFRSRPSRHMRQIRIDRGAHNYQVKSGSIAMVITDVQGSEDAEEANLVNGLIPGSLNQVIWSILMLLGLTWVRIKIIECFKSLTL